MSLAKVFRRILGKGSLADEACRPDPLSRRQCIEARCVDLIVVLLQVAGELGCAIDDGRLEA